jgi:hypothetical protein
MGKTGNQESRGPAKQRSSGRAVTVILIICLLGIMPVLLWVTLPESAAYSSLTASSTPLQTAATATELQICSSDAVSVHVPGAAGAVLYRLSPDCSSPDPATTVQILVVGFSSTEAMNSAIYAAQVTYKDWPTTNTAAFYIGTSVILIQGAPGDPAVLRISASLTEQGAVRII